MRFAYIRLALSPLVDGGLPSADDASRLLPGVDPCAWLISPHRSDGEPALSAPTPIMAPHSLIFSILIVSPLVTLVPRLTHLFYQLLLCGVSGILCVPKALWALRTL